MTGPRHPAGHVRRRDGLVLRLGRTLVDSLDTLWIMGLPEEFDEAVAYIAAEIDFGARRVRG
jgi:hypothetical protein